VETNVNSASPLDGCVRHWGCNSCDWLGLETELLRAPSPFEPETEVLGCPKCKAIDDFFAVCDEPGCTKEAGCGFPTANGYRHTCGKHWVPNAEVTGGPLAARPVD